MAIERRTQPLERFWPYADHPEQPTPEELAALDPDLREALFGPRNLPFSITIVFPPFDGEHYDRAVEMAKQSAEYARLAPATRCVIVRASFRVRRCNCVICSNSPDRTRTPRC